LTKARVGGGEKRKGPKTQRKAETGMEKEKKKSTGGRTVARGKQRKKGKKRKYTQKKEKVHLILEQPVRHEKKEDTAKKQDAEPVEEIYEPKGKPRNLVGEGNRKDTTLDAVEGFVDEKIRDQKGKHTEGN